MSKFSLMAADINKTVQLMFVQSMRDALERGFAHTVEQTYQDSSNAAVHWAIGVEGRVDPSAGELGEVRDFRETLARGTILYPVGRRREKRTDTNTAMVLRTAKIVLDREFEAVISKYAAGNNPSTKFYFYTAVDGKYADNAKVFEAGRKGMSEVVVEFERQIAESNVRRYRLK